MNISTTNLAKTIDERTSVQVNKVLNRNNYVFDSHVHIFDKKCINEGYFLTRLAMERVFPNLDLFSSFNNTLTDAAISPIDNEEGIYEMMNDETKLASWSEITKALKAQGISDEQNNLLDSTLWSRHLFLARLLTKRKMKTIYDLFKKKCALTTLDRFNKKDLISVILQMDLGKTWNGETKKRQSEQVDELRNLAKRYPILPFFAVDPRRANDQGKENLYKLFERAFTKGDGAFFGIKVYPSLGYLPSDYRLDEIFALCEQYQIPVVTHCGGEMISSFKKRIKVFDGQIEKTMQGNSRKDLAFKLNAATEWEKVLTKYPKLKLNLAHFGNWSSTGLSTPKYVKRIRKIKQLVLDPAYPNVYTDFSYSLIHEDSIGIFNAEMNNDLILNKTLFGTDYWVVLFAENIQKSQKEFFDNIDQKTINKIVNENPMKFLFNK